MDDDVLTMGLACAALHPGLRSILMFDVPYPIFKTAVETFRQMLQITTKQTVIQESLAPSAQDDDLWGSTLFPGNQDTPFPSLLSGLFSKERSMHGIQLITIPNLTHLSLPAARACIMLMDNSIAHLERNGQSEHWNTHYCWLAACNRNDVGTISPHLLDRFALRLTWQNQKQTDLVQRVADLLTTMHSLPANHNEARTLSSEIQQRLIEALHRQVEVTPEAVKSVLAYTPAEHMYPRRDIALARLAHAVAQLEGETSMSTRHVIKAAALIGLEEYDVFSSNTTKQDEKQKTELVTKREHALPNPATLPASSSMTEVDNSIVTISDNETINREESLTLAGPYPEDSQPIEREMASLRIPLPYYSAGRSDRGPIFGVEPSDTLRDLAIVSTLQTAAMFQTMRCKETSISPPKSQSLLFELDDLRRYRRGYVTEQMLLLLLDYTSMRTNEWQEALIPYLSMAYIERASISIIKVGAADAAHYLQAEQVSAKNILGANIGRALETQPGKATPLAHGLDLALRTLRHSLQHGRNTMQQVRFVVVSDGRGNIPLEASRNKHLSSIVAREGIEDALNIAQAISKLNGVEITVLHPRTRYYVDLPLTLAYALHAQVKTFPPLDPQEVKYAYQ